MNFRAFLPTASALVLALFAATPAHAALPRPAHVVVVIEENKSFGEIVGRSSAPYINDLIAHGALFTHAYGVTHPSLPNYFALFSGRVNTNGDDCPALGIPKDAPNLASELTAAHLSFAGYSESLPSKGFTGCWAGTYARKHAPWVHFSNVAPAQNLPFAAFPPFDALPAVSIVVPDVDNDMHDGSVARGDAWLKRHIGPLFEWAKSHDTLLVLTWDEGYDNDNHVATLFAGPMVRPGRYAQRIDHYAVLRTIETMYGLRPTGRAAQAAPVADCWR